MPSIGRSRQKTNFPPTLNLISDRCPPVPDERLYRDARLALESDRLSWASDQIEIHILKG
ncbi:hypothetical protein [Scytonema sp. HK-05]|uniref:hypothetical protein n=1 Tax=Scytonema sp. HK-05 TaxID=1137095 RepID=UPI0013019726|nr:hypothetical protein [Scytonema sp. HK-05]